MSSLQIDLKRSIAALASLFVLMGVNAQDGKPVCDTIASLCEKHITSEYISDGQMYRALLYDNEISDFEATLFGGTTYRVAGCSGMSDGNLIFSIYDQERNLLFTNEEYNNEPYWDLVVANTMNVTIEGRLDLTKQGSGCSVILMGFQK